MRKQTKRLQAAPGLENFARDLLAVGRYHLSTLAWQAGRRLVGTDRKIIKRYLEGAGPKKLQVGCGHHLLPGWLNSDYHPKAEGVLYLDVKSRFPLQDNLFDYLYSEHLIEHLTQDQGLHMLRECWRVLKPGGKLRISTPDLSFLIDLYPADKSPLQQAYVKWASEGLAAPEECADAFVINNFVRAWGHKFIYDAPALRHALQRSGYGHITRCSLGESQDEALRGLENDGRMPEGFVRLESMIMEATRS